MKPVFFCLVFLLFAAICCAQDAEQPNPRDRESLTGFPWLKQFEGDWDAESDGTMNCRAIGKQWIINEFTFQTGLFSSQTIGYDAEKKHFVGIWVDASSNHIWHYKGSLDKTGKVLILEAEGPDMNDPKKMRKYRDTYEFKSKNEISVVTLMLDDKNQWQTFNKSKMTRKTK